MLALNCIDVWVAAAQMLLAVGRYNSLQRWYRVGVAWGHFMEWRYLAPQPARGSTDMNE
jgi:hypothetical protein